MSPSCRGDHAGLQRRLAGFQGRSTLHSHYCAYMHYLFPLLHMIEVPHSSMVHFRGFRLIHRRLLPHRPAHEPLSVESRIFDTKVAGLWSQDAQVGPRLSLGSRLPVFVRFVSRSLCMSRRIQLPSATCATSFVAVVEISPEEIPLSTWSNIVL